MALTLDRWIAIAIGGCLIAMALIFQDQPEVSWPETPRRALVVRHDALSNASRRAAYRLRQIQLRDSIRAAAGPARSGTRVLVGPSFVPQDRARLNAFLDRVQLQRGGASGAIDQAFIIDTLTTLRGRTIGHGAFDYMHILPTAGYDRCMSIGMFGGHVLGGRVMRYPWFNTFESAGRFLGPCAFYDRFGPPGPAIDRWLRDGGWAYGTAGARMLTAEAPALYYRRVNSIFGYDLGMELREFSTTAGYRCLTGDAAPCLTSIMNPSSDRNGRRIRALPNGIVEARSQWWYSTTLGHWQGSLLADMAAMIGDDNFRKFWTSALPPAEAFSAATGQELGAWTASWARKSYGNVGRGPTIPARSFAFAVALFVISLGGAIAAAGRRQVA